MSNGRDGVNDAHARGKGQRLLADLLRAHVNLRGDVTRHGRRDGSGGGGRGTPGGGAVVAVFYERGKGSLGLLPDRRNAASKKCSQSQSHDRDTGRGRAYERLERLKENLPKRPYFQCTSIA